MNNRNWHSKWRLEQAVAVSKRLEHFSGLQAITVGGSVARGYADAYSDIEMPLFWIEQPAPSVRQAIAETLEADSLHFSTRPAGEDNFLINGFQVDLWHIAVSEAEVIFNEVLKGHNTDVKYSNFIDTIQICVPLTGEPVLTHLQQISQDYPEALAVRAIQKHLSRFRAKHLELHVIRANPTLLYGTISDLQKLVFLVLLAVNRRHFPAFKWMYPTLETLRYKPPRVHNRLRHTFTCPPAEAVALTRQIIAETLALVNNRFPQIDTDSIKQDFSFSRTAHHTPVELY